MNKKLIILIAVIIVVVISIVTIILVQNPSNPCKQKPYEKPGGMCDMITQGYYFDGKECQYAYRGCYGVFPFETLEECKNVCE